jgi:ribonuclease P protein component
LIIFQMSKFENDPRNRLCKSERLSSKIQIQALFTEGKSFSTPPFVVRYSKLEVQDLANHQILVSVSKRNFKRAVDRNRLKRQIREAYRLNKHLLEGLSDKYAIAYIYTFKKMIPYKDLENKLIESLSRLQIELSKRNED